MSPDSNRRPSGPMVFRIAMRDARLVTGARVIADLTIENTTDEPIEIAHPMFRTSVQPVYTVTSPEGEATTFTPARGAGDADETKTLVIAPGETWRGDLAISDRVDVKPLGTYTIAGSLEWNGRSTQTEPSEFEVVRANFSGLSTSMSQAADGTVERECVFIQSAGDTLEWFGAVIRETDAKNGEVKTPNPQRRGSLPPATRAVLGPRANYSTGLDPLRWIVGHDDTLITVGSNRSEGHTRIVPPSALRRVLTPLATAAELDALALLDRGAGSVIGIARVARATGELPAETPMTDLWSLDARPIAVAVAPAPEKQGDAIAVVAISDEGDRVHMRVAHVTLDGRVLASRSGTFKGVAADDAVAVHWGSDGLTRVSFLCHALAPAPLRYRLVEVVFDESLEVARPPEGPPTLSIGAAVDARIDYFEPELGRISRGALIRTATAAWFISAAGVATAAAVPLTGPVGLLCGRYRWYGVWATPAKIQNVAL